ncbi:acyl-CoA dehydrogenase [Chromatiales bacterium (ex Bugula neritina AB1)]|nr:acyl-CoA dehydrogenase [Chromatiales bacterium (ex Bugula neritina AB1)]
MRFVLDNVVGMEEISRLPGFEEASPDLVAAVLEEAGKFAAEVLAPLNKTGDAEGAAWTADGVTTPAGWIDAYSQFSESGWNSLAFDPEYGGQGMPRALAAAVQEMWHSSNMAFGLCPLLTQGAVHAIASHASSELKQTYLEKMVSGEWTGTMNLTEPQAGSDLAAVRTRAEPQLDHYLISGQKIFITYGDHDLTDNTIHLVLARTPDAPAGVKGISLFVCPKFILNEDGSPGKRNDVRCVSIEHKLGIHASPTCVMSFGDEGGAVGYLVGEENRGLMYMFTMMNEARLAVGIEGYALGEMAYQHAADFARDRKQGAVLLGDRETQPGIINHPDVRRMLMTMRAQVEAARVIAYDCAAAFDFASHHSDDEVRTRFNRRGALLTPIVKGWSTEIGVDICSLGVQIHGGMGFIEETGAAQYLRDVRITPIYEGTTGIQANDLIGRKTRFDGGQGMEELLIDMRGTLQALEGEQDSHCERACKALAEAIDIASRASQQALAEEDPALSAAVASDYLMLMGYVTGCWAMARSVLAVRELDDTDFVTAKLSVCRFYFDCIAPRAHSHRIAIQNADPEHFELDIALM